MRKDSAQNKFGFDAGYKAGGVKLIMPTKSKISDKETSKKKQTKKK